jgi:N-methylhydantoinase A
VVNTLIDEMSTEVAAFVRETGHRGETLRELRAYMRYAGQGWEIPVNVNPANVSAGHFGPADTLILRQAFIDAYTTLFGHAVDGLDVEVVSWALSLRTEQAVPERVTASVGEMSLSVAPLDRRPVFDAKSGRFHDCAIYERLQLPAGVQIPGPAVIVENETSTLVTPGYGVTLQQDGCLLVQRRETRRDEQGGA